MQCLSICVHNKINDVAMLIEKELIKQDLQKTGFFLDPNTLTNDENTIYTIKRRNNVNPGHEQYQMLVKTVSNALAGYIIKNYETKIIMKIISNNYDFCNNFERSIILKKTLEIIANEDNTECNTSLGNQRKKVIVNKLTDYLHDSENLILEGFINFRLKEYMLKLEELVDSAAFQYNTEKEYLGFIELLRYFVKVQIPQYEIINILITGESCYKLVDQNCMEVSNKHVQEYFDEIPYEEINNDDLLISTLITLAPKKIKLHKSSFEIRKELLETIKKVFLGKVTICENCRCYIIRSRNQY